MAGILALGATNDYACALVYEHDSAASAATGWPWLFRATQHIDFVESGLSVTLTVENLSDDVMPAGMGLHPHFPFASDTRVSMSRAARVVMNDDFLPATKKLGDTGKANPLAEPTLADTAVWMTCSRIETVALRLFGQASLGLCPLSQMQS